MTIKKKTSNKYSKDFKKSIVTLIENGKSFIDIEREYGVSYSAASKWKKLFTMVTTDDGEIITAKQVKVLQKRNAQLEEENIILKKAAALFMQPYDRK